MPGQKGPASFTSIGQVITCSTRTGSSVFQGMGPLTPPIPIQAAVPVEEPPPHASAAARGAGEAGERSRRVRRRVRAGGGAVGMSRYGRYGGGESSRGPRAAEGGAGGKARRVWERGDYRGQLGGRRVLLERGGRRCGRRRRCRRRHFASAAVGEGARPGARCSREGGKGPRGQDGGGRGRAGRGLSPRSLPAPR